MGDLLNFPVIARDSWLSEYQRKSWHPHTYDNRPCPPCGDFEGCHRHDKKIPPVVVLCGSTKFKEVFASMNYHLTLQGFIVLSIGCDAKVDDELYITPEQKIHLDELHKRKIDLADIVFILNVGGYIGDSTRSELEYARQEQKVVHSLEEL